MHTNEDKKLRDKVVAAAGNPALDISVEKGVVTLKGEVADDAKAMDIVKMVKKVPGVTSVTNNLKPKAKRMAP